MPTPLHPLVFEERLPKEDADSAAHVRFSLGLGLASPFGPRRSLHIIANGPSALSAPWEDFSWFTHTMALNGSIAACHANNHEPTYWAACDPQPLVADFIPNSLGHTKYLPASKCHPLVFNRLGSLAQIWHVDDGSLPAELIPYAIPTASSITLMAIQLAPRLGYRDLHVWGWDCCVEPGRHHASGPLITDEIRPLEFRRTEDGPIEREFLTTNGLAYETQQAVALILALRWYGVHVTVHGPGLVRHTLDFHASLERAQ